MSEELEKERKGFAHVADAGEAAARDDEEATRLQAVGGVRGDEEHGRADDVGRDREQLCKRVGFYAARGVSEEIREFVRTH